MTSNFSDVNSELQIQTGTGIVMHLNLSSQHSVWLLLYCCTAVVSPLPSLIHRIIIALDSIQFIPPFDVGIMLSLLLGPG